MFKVSNNNIWLWKEPNERWKENVIAYLRSEQPTNADIAVLDCEDSCIFEESIPLIYYIFDLCVKFHIFNEKKVMLLNYKDFLLAVELCLEKFLLNNNQEGTDETKENVFDYLQLYKNDLKQTDECSSNKLVCYIKTFLAQNNCIDVWQMVKELQVYKANNAEFLNHLSNTKFLILGRTETELFKEILEALSFTDTLTTLNIETPLNSSLLESFDDESLSKIDISSEITKIEELSFDEVTDIQLGSATKEYVEDVIVSFLSLLVNSRNELSLSKVLISPYIELNHSAFTHLKHLAKEKEMPLCQTAISYVTRTRLGGKGYAPSPDCPLLAYIKNLELFVDTLNELQTLIEDSDPKILLKRLINNLKKKLLKSWNIKFKQNAIESAITNLHCIADKMKLIERKQFERTSLICQEAHDVLYFFNNYVTCSSFTFDSDKILKQKQCKRTPINLPPLLGYFRSPDEESISYDNKSICNEDSIASDNSSLGFPVPLMSYFHASDNSLSVNSTLACTDSNTPTKLNFKGSINEEMQIQVIDVVDSPEKKKEQGSVKRPILKNITNDNTEKPNERLGKKIKTQALKNKQILKKEIKKTKLTKKFKLIKGQDKITSFFKVA